MENKRAKIYIVGLQYSLKFYMQIHKRILNQILLTDNMPIDLIIPGYNRRSYLSLPFDFLKIIKWLKNTKPLYIVSVGPKVGFLFAVASIFLNFKLIHWYTGQEWALRKIKLLAPSYWTDFTINILSYRTLCDSKEQAIFLKNNFFIKEITYDELGSINFVSNDLYLIGKQKLKKINTTQFTHNYPLKVGFLGRICSEKGLEIIKELSQDQTLRKKYKFLVRGPSDNSISKSKKTLNSIEINFLSFPFIDFKEGFIKNKKFFSSIDIFLLPSKREGFGSVALEAQACGIPVICSDIYGLYSSVKEGIGGIHCSNIKDYKDALNGFQNFNNYKRFCENAYLFSLKYSEKVFSYNLFKLYNSFIPLSRK